MIISGLGLKRLATEVFLLTKLFEWVYMCKSFPLFLKKIIKEY